MRISVAADERTGVADTLVEELRRRGHEPIAHGALEPRRARRLGMGERGGGARRGRGPRRPGDRRLLDGDRLLDRGEQGSWHPGGASLDAETAEGARRWNDANVLALSLRVTSEAVLSEILDAWFAGEPSKAEDDVANIRHVDQIG